MTSLSMRMLTASDKPAMMLLQQEVLAALPDPRWYFPSDEWEFDAWLAGGEATGCFEGDTLAGYAVITPAANRFGRSYAQVLGEPVENTYDFHDVLVLPRYRGRGIHTRFIEMFTEDVRRAGGIAIYSTVDPDNVVSWHNFEKCGYVCVRQQPAYDGRERRYYKLTL